MKNKIKTIILILLLYLIILFFSNFVYAISVSVCTSSCNYTSIQDAIYNASTSDIINVLNGSYTENITVNVSVTLNGTPYISLTGGFNVSADNVTIQGFNITEGIALGQTGLNGAYRMGIYVISNNNIFYNNYFLNIDGKNGTDSQGDNDEPGAGGIGAAIYLSASSNNNITNNTIANINGGKAGDNNQPCGPNCEAGADGGIGVGIYLTDSNNNNISNNNISSITGGKGGKASGDASGTGGLAAGIYLTNSQSNNITSNSILSLTGGKGGDASGGGGTGADQTGFGIYISSNSYNNEIDSTNTVDGDKIIYYYNKIGITVKDNTLTKNSSPINLGKIVLINSSNFNIANNTIANFTGESGNLGIPGEDGGIGAGIYLSNSSNVNISFNTISFIYGGKGGGGKRSNNGGIGGIATAIYLSNSINNNISANNITEIKGGIGGNGGYGGGSGGSGGIGSGIYFGESANNNNIVNNTIYKINGSAGGIGNNRGSGGTGGIGSGIYFSDSINNNISANNITEIKGGIGGAPGPQAPGSDGANQQGFGIYINSDSLNNEIDSTNILDGNKILYYYNKTGITIRNNVLTKNNSPTNLGKIVLINSSNSLITNNTIANFIGESGATWNAAEIGSGIYLFNSTNNNITLNTITQIHGGLGGTGREDANGASGGNSHGIYLSYSSNNNITNNTITEISGGAGGTGGYGFEGSGGTGGTGGIGMGIYLSNSSNNNMTYNNITNINFGLAGGPGISGDPGTNGTAAALYLTANSNNTITYNWLYDNSNYSIYNNQNINITAELNYFNATSSSAVAALIYDYSDDSGLGIVDYDPWYLDITFANLSNELLAVTINAPIDNYNSSNSTITFNATINSTYAITNVSLYANFSGSYIVNETNSTGSNNVDYIFTTSIPDGSYIWSIQVCNSLEICNSSSNRTLEIDTTAPVVSILSPPSSTIATSDVITTASFSDFNNVTCQAKIDSNAWQDMDNDGTKAGTANYTFAGQADGPHTIQVNCSDTANIPHYTNKSVAFTINAIADATAPTITITSPISYISSSSATLNVNYSDASNTDCYANVDSGTWQNMTGDGATAGIAAYTFTSQTDGTHTINVNCTDSSGNNATSNVSFTVDTVYPIITLLSPANGSSWTSSSTVNFNFNVTDTSIANCSLIIDNDISETGTSISVNISQTISKSLSNAAYDWSINCTDMAGNINASNETRTITVSYSGGGGGGGGSGSTTTLPSQTQSLGSIRAGETKSAEFTKDFGITQIDITAKSSASGISIKVEETKTPKIQAMTPWKGSVYKYLEITPRSIANEKLFKVVIKFKILKSWISSYDENKVWLMKFSTKWISLPTKKLSSDSDYVYYEAETNSFSLFAITAEKKAAIPVSTQQETIQEETTENVTVEQPVIEEPEKTIEEIPKDFTEPKNISKIGWVIAVAAIIAIIVTGFILMRGKQGNILKQDFKEKLKNIESGQGDYNKLQSAYNWLPKKDKEKYYLRLKQLYDWFFRRRI